MGNSGQEQGHGFANGKKQELIVKKLECGNGGRGSRLGKRPRTTREARWRLKLGESDTGKEGAVEVKQER